MTFSHIDDCGRARMVDIGSKPVVRRIAQAAGKVLISSRTAELIRTRQLTKGDPFEAARLSGIQAAKQTASLVPLCHTIPLEFVDVEIELGQDCWNIRSKVASRWATGVEMEALTAVSVAALALYDMCKAVDKEMSIGEIRLVSKTKEPLKAR